MLFAVAGEEERAEFKGCRPGRRSAPCSWHQRRSTQAGAAVPTGAGLKHCPQEAAQGPATGKQPGKRPNRTGNTCHDPVVVAARTACIVFSLYNSHPYACTSRDSIMFTFDDGSDISSMCQSSQLLSQLKCDKGYPVQHVQQSCLFLIYTFVGETFNSEVAPPSQSNTCKVFHNLREATQLLVFDWERLYSDNLLPLHKGAQPVSLPHLENTINPGLPSQQLVRDSSCS